jgi:DNA-binding NarL/FixJ family response regulator
LARPRILLADDHADFLALVVQLIAAEFEVVQTFDNGDAMLKNAPSLAADLLLIDISMPGLSGLEAARRLRDAGCGSKVVFLTVHEDQDYLQSALAAGALGYVVKHRVATDLVPALQAAAAGHRYVSPALAGCLPAEKPYESLIGNEH